MPKIIIHHPDGTSAKYGLNGPSFTIGRAEGNDIVLPAGAASSHHALLKMNETGDFTVTDLESTNKTMVNGRAIQTSPLRHGDSLVFGDIAAEYHSEIAAAGTSYYEDHPTQIYETRGRAPVAPYSPATPQPAESTRAAPVTLVPQVIHRPSSTTARKRARSQDDGCFTLIVFAFVLPAAFFTGLVIRHHQDRSQWLWDYVQVLINR